MFSKVPREANAVQKDAWQRRAKQQAWERSCKSLMAPLMDWHGDRNLRKLGKLGFQAFSVPAAGSTVRGLQAPGRGTAPPVTYCCGLGTSAAHHVPLLKFLLKQSSRVVTVSFDRDFDVSNYTALSDAFSQTIAGIRADVTKEPMVLAGHSIAANLILWEATKPDAKRNFVKIIVGSPPGLESTSRAERDQAVQLFKVETRADALTIAKRAFPQAPAVLRPIIAAGVKVRLDVPAVQQLVRGDMPRRYLPGERLRCIDVPCMVIWGEDDGLVPAEPNCSYLTQHLKPNQVWVRTAAGVGHGNFASSPEVFDKAIEAFLAA